MAAPLDASTKVFTVGDWVVDGNTLSVRRAGTEHALEPRAFHVLHYLAERGGELVTIDELMDAHWSGTVVTPNAVTRVIAQLRKALEDDARNPLYIETVARTGYRLIATVGSLQLRRSRFVLPAIVLAFLAVAAVMLWPRDDPGMPSVAVMPFTNLTGDESLGYLSDGVAEEVIHALARERAIQVTPRSVSFAAQDGHELDVDYLVEGSVRREAQTVKITAQLVATESGAPALSVSREYDQQDLFSGQEQISREIVAALADDAGIEIAPRETVVEHRPLPEAYDLYLKGRHIWHRRGSAPFEDAVAMFAEAVKVDPDFARGWAALASAYITWPSYSPQGFATFASAEDVAKRALELDPNLAEPYGVLGTFASTRSQWREALSLLREGVARNDRNPTAHHWLADFLLSIGYVNESFRHTRRALELDPTYIAPTADVAWAELYWGSVEQGEALFEALWQQGVQGPEVWVGRYFGLVLSGRFADARDWLDLVPMLDDAAVELHRRYIDALAANAADAELVNDIINGRLDHRDKLSMLVNLEAYDGFLDVVRWRAERGLWIQPQLLFGPNRAIVGRPEMVEAARISGLVEFWDEQGWGDVCRRTSETIVCDAAAVDLSVVKGK